MWYIGLDWMPLQKQDTSRTIESNGTYRLHNNGVYRLHSRRILMFYQSEDPGTYSNAAFVCPLELLRKVKTKCNFLFSSSYLSANHAFRNVLGVHTFSLPPFPPVKLLSTSAQLKGQGFFSFSLPLFLLRTAVEILQLACLGYFSCQC